MFRNRTAWLNSRPGARWTPVSFPFASFSPAVTATRLKRLQTGEYIAVGYYYPTGSSNPTQVIARSTELKSWTIHTIADFSFGDIDGNGTVYIVVGVDASGANEHVKRFDSTFAPLAAPTITPAITDPGRVIWGRLSGTDYFVIIARTSYASSSSALGDTFTALNYPSAGTGGIRKLDYYPAIDTYVELRAFIFPVIFRIVNNPGAFVLDYLTFTTSGTVAQMYSFYDVATNYIYILVSRVNPTTNASSFNFFVYTPSGTLVSNTTKTLPLSTYISAAAYHAETQTLFITLSKNSPTPTHELQSIQISFAPGIVIGDLQLIRATDSIESMITTNSGVMTLSSTGTISVSP